MVARGGRFDESLDCMFELQQHTDLVKLGPGVAKGAHNCLATIPWQLLRAMRAQTCAIRDLCYSCGGGYANCRRQSAGGACNRADTAPWLLDMKDCELARIDLPSKLSLEMDKRCVFVCGLGDGVLNNNPIAKVEAGIIGHVRPWGDNYRVVMRVEVGHAFIFFEHESQMNAFLGKAARRDSAWGAIAVCNYQLGVQPYSGKCYSGSRNGIDRPTSAAVMVPSMPVTQPTQPAGAGLSALNSMAQRVHTPVGGGYGMARQVVRVGVAADAIVEDMTADNFTWAQANLFLQLQPKGMSRVCSLCGQFNNRTISMKTAHEEGGANIDNRKVCLQHCYKLAHRDRVATKRAHAAAAAIGQTGATMSQSDGTSLLHRIVCTPIATSHTSPHDSLCRLHPSPHDSLYRSQPTHTLLMSLLEVSQNLKSLCVYVLYMLQTTPLLGGDMAATRPVMLVALLDHMHRTQV